MATLIFSFGGSGNQIRLKRQYAEIRKRAPSTREIRRREQRKAKGYAKEARNA